MVAKKKTIVAIGTPMGRSALGIVRMSGPSSIKILQKMVAKRDESRHLQLAEGASEEVGKGTIRQGGEPEAELASGKEMAEREQPFRAPKGESAVEKERIERGVLKIEPNRMTYATFTDPGSKRLIDTGMFVYYKAPRSYTGEAMVEFTLHGNPYILEDMVRVLVALGAVQAGPGEFTERAYLNGKMDLSQAEAVAETIAAQNREHLRLSLNQLEGTTSKEIRRLMEFLIDLLAHTHVVFDYPEDVSDEGLKTTVQKGILELEGLISEILRFYEENRRLREGLKLVIIGRPNVGKSTLFNRLVGYERALVTPEAGTTRDYLEDRLLLASVPVSIIDTAGYRESESQTEKLGVERTLEMVKRADIVIVVSEAEESADPEIEKIVEEAEGVKVIRVRNKIDLLGKEAGRFSSAELGVSALTGAGIELLRQEVLEAVRVGQTEGQFLVTLRQKDLLDFSKVALERGLDSLRRGLSLDAVALDLQEALDKLSSILQEPVEGKVLDRIFSSFCVGK